jgi:hypothetical protein
MLSARELHCSIELKLIQFEFSRWKWLHILHSVSYIDLQTRGIRDAEQAFNIYAFGLIIYLG